MTKPLRVGIVGLGRILDLHAPGYIGHPDAKVVALCDVQQRLVEERRTFFPDAATTTSFEDLLKNDLDLIEILTPHPFHRDMTIAALEAGCAVSVQKPMAMTVEECDAMIAAARRTGRHLKLFENFVFYPPLVKARELLREGVIGKPLRLRMNVMIGDRTGAWNVPVETDAWRFALGSEGRGGPFVFDHGHHLMAVALWLFGDVRDGFAQIETTTSPTGAAYDAPASLMWRHRDPPVHTTWDVSLALRMKVRTDYYATHEDFEIQGEEGIIRVNRCSDRMLEEPVLSLYRDGEMRSWHNIDSDWGESFRRSTRHFVDFLKGREPQIILTAAEGRRVIELFHLLNRASREERLIAHPDLVGDRP
jgi:predicted dehydrogenase